MASSTHFLRSFVARQWRALAGAGASTGFVALADLAKPWPIKLVIDYIFAGREGAFELRAHDLQLLGAIAGLVLAIALTEATATYYSDLSLKRAGERIAHDLRVAVYAHMQRLSLAFHERRQKGDLVTLVTSDANSVGQAFSESLGTILQAALLFVGMLVVTLLLDPLLSVAVFLVSPVLAVVTFRYRRRIRSLARHQRAHEGEIASLATESLSAMPVVRALGTESYEENRVTERSETRREVGVEAARVDARFAGLIDLLGAVAVSVALVLGVFRVAAGVLSPGDLVVFATYARRLYRPLYDIARQASRVSRAMARAERIGELLAADDVLPQAPGAFSSGRAAGDLEFERVSFAYEPRRPALRDLSLRVPAGSRVAVVGRSGAGKSTVGALTARFYDPSSGTVLIDGRDARDCSLRWLRDQVGLLLQDTVLFSGTVAENIAYGTDARLEEVVAAAKAAAAHEFISELPSGYATDLGPRGVALSGGQRQRIGIARTLLRDPSILILDEPTTGLDPENEARVLHGLRVLMDGRTTVLMTHSVALARTADRVVVVDDGRVAEEGAPEDLLARGGQFYRFAREQGVVERSAPPAPPPRRSPARRRQPPAKALGGGNHRPPAPADPALPQLPVLLDAAAMAPVLERSLGRDRTVSSVRARQLRYKPHTNLRVRYEVGVGGARHDAVVTIAADRGCARRARKPEYVAMARRVNGRSPAADPLVYDPGVDALIEWFPLDLSLPALAEHPARLRRRLRTAGLAISASESEPVRLVYKLRRRAVLELDGHVLKAYGSESRYRAAEARLKAVSSGFPVQTPSFEAAFPALRVTVQPLLTGRVPASAAQVAHEAGAMLRNLHDSAVGGRARALWRVRLLDALAPARKQARPAELARSITTIAPHLGPRLAPLVHRLETTAPADEALVPSHGDFHAGQLLETNRELAVVDLDHLCAASPALDVAGYGAHLVNGYDGDLQTAQGALEPLVEGYGEEPAALRWYLATSILARGVFPFQCVDDEWPERVEAMVDAAEAALAL
jgi:ABC-type multidrug transport system fused ATPase/permease subunit